MALLPPSDFPIVQCLAVISLDRTAVIALRSLQTGGMGMSEHDATSDPQNTIAALQQRVANLEATVGDLQRATRQLYQALDARQIPIPTAQPAAPQAVVPAVAVPTPAPSPVNVPRPSFDLRRDGEWWLNKIGIGLLLLGIGFLFKYSIDQGWLTPLVRVLFGVGVGAGLIATGLALRNRRSHFGHVLQGGGAGALYISTFAAFQLYSLLSYPLAFGAMCAITLLMFALSLQQNTQILALIAALGGFGTPFVLYSGSNNVAGLVGYTGLVVLGIAAIYAARGWRSLLWLGSIATWFIWLAAADALPYQPIEALFDRWAVQAGIVLAVIVFWALPLLREARRSPAAATPTPPRYVDLHLLALLTPFTALGLSTAVWTLATETWGFITLAVAVLWFVASRFAQRDPLRDLAYTHLITSLLLLTLSFVLLLEGNALLFALAAQAALLLVVARRTGDQSLAVFGHLLWSVVALWVAGRLTDSWSRGTPLLNGDALTDVAVLGLAAATTRFVQLRRATLVYWIVIHAGVLLLFNRELGRLPEGSGIVTVAWGVYGVALLIAGLRRDVDVLARFGIGTLLLVVGKLLVVDLAEVDAIWRVLLFMGFGGLFLLLSYVYQSLWRPSQRPPTP
jgi:uncharacterized membrane protein